MDTSPAKSPYFPYPSSSYLSREYDWWDTLFFLFLADPAIHVHMDATSTQPAHVDVMSAKTGVVLGEEGDLYWRFSIGGGKVNYLDLRGVFSTRPRVEEVK